MKKIQYRIFLMVAAQWLLAATVMAEDVLNLEGTFKGNREQPKVLYIVPWQAPGSTADLERPLEGQLQGLFQPMDRNSFRRELKYFKLLHEDSKNLADKGLLE